MVKCAGNVSLWDRGFRRDFTEFGLEAEARG